MLGAAFSDDMPGLDRQMGCMAGIFQIFDRRRMLTARRDAATAGSGSGSGGRRQPQQHKRQLPPGN